MKLSLRWRVNPAHAYLDVFLGPDRDHLANVGQLVMRHDEARELRLALRGGGWREGGIDGVFESGWPHEGED